MYIPLEVYRETERMLRRRRTLLPEARSALAAAEARATDIRSPVADRVSGKGTPGDRTAAGADILMQAHEQLAGAEKWLKVFAQMDRLFGALTPEGRIARLLYREGKSQEEICCALGVSRQTVRRRRDTYVCHCALLAAKAGLIDVRGGA